MTCDRSCRNRADGLDAIQAIVTQDVVARQSLVQDAKDLATQVASVEIGYQKAVASVPGMAAGLLQAQADYHDRAVVVEQWGVS